MLCPSDLHGISPSAPQSTSTTTLASTTARTLADTTRAPGTTIHSPAYQNHSTETPSLSTLCPHLDASVTTQVEVKLSRVGDFRVHGCACWNVSAFPNLEQHKSPLDAAGGGKVMQASKRDSATLSSILKTLSWPMHLLRTTALN